MTAPGATVLHIPAGVGIDQSVREEHVQPGTANLYQENVRLTRQGSLEKCPGYSALSSARVGSGSRSAGHRVAAYRDSIVTSDGDQLDVYSPAMTQWTQAGRLPGCDASISKVSSTSALGYGVDIAYGSGFIVIVSAEHDDYTNAYSYPLVRIIDATTEKLVKAVNLTEVVGTNIIGNLRVAVISTHLVVAYSIGANIYAVRMSLSAIESGFASAATLATNYTPTFQGMALHALSDRMVLGYANTVGGTTRITLKTFDHTVDALTVSVTQNETTSADTVICIALAGTEELWTAWSHLASTSVYVSARNASTLASVIAGTSVITVASAPGVNLAMGRSAANTVYLAASSASTVSANWLESKTVRLNNASGVLTQDRRNTLIQGWSAMSQPFTVSGRTYLEMYYDDADGDIRNAVLVDITAAASTTGVDRNQTVRPVAWLAPRANIANVSQAGTRHVATNGSSVWYSAHITRSSAVSTALSLASYDFASSLRHQALAYADCLHLTGGIHCQFDGEQVYEAGFIVPPRLNVAETGTGITGTYAYTAIYEYSDALGNVIWSQAAPVQTITVANKTVTVSVRLPSVTAKEGYDSNTDMAPQGFRRIRTKLFRTLSTGTGDYYLHTTIQDNPTGGIVTVSDSTADASISSNAKLYRTPGIVGTAKDRQAMGSSRGLAECNGVLVSIDGDGVTLRACAERTVGEAPWHHDTLQLPTDGDGELTALASLDGTLVAFKRDAIFLVPIEPSSANCAVGGFGSPRRIAVDVGCIDPRSVLVTGKGVFFQSDRGIELLTRSLTVEQIGVYIQDTFADYPNVKAAVLDVRNGLARFSLAQTGSSTVGVDAVYDLVAEKWVSIDKKTGAAASAQAVSAAYAYHSSSYRYVWLDSVGTVRYEDFSTYLHGGSWVSSYWEPAWLKTELQREHQMWQAVVLHERQSACGLTAEVAYDWAAYDSGDNKVWSESEIATYTREVEARVTGRYTAIKFRFHDTTPVTLGTGQGLEFIGLSLDLAPHQGPTQGTPRLAVASRK